MHLAPRYLGCILLAWGCHGSPRSSQADPASRPPALHHYEITPASLPAPSPPATGPRALFQADSGGVDNGPRLVPRPPGAALAVPPAFSVGTFAADLAHPRWLALAPGGDVFVAESTADRIVVLRDADGDGSAESRFVFAEHLDEPFGMAFGHGFLYIASTNAIVRFRYRSGQTQAEGAPEKIATLSGEGYNQHWTRNLLFSADGAKLFVTVGSRSNRDVEPDPMRAAISILDPDGKNLHVFASGLRNPVGLALEPKSHALFTTVNERDGMGDDLPPDYLTEVQEGAFYGWPYAYIGPHEDPRHKGERPDLVARTRVPDLLIQAHSAALGLVFYEGAMFPSTMRGDAFVALHGSWNRSKRTGYKVIRVPFRNGHPSGGYDDFLTGFMLDEKKRDVWGRPVGLLVAKDGALLIADDGGQRIWRVATSQK